MVAQWLALSLQQSSRGFDAYLGTFFVEFCDVLSCDEPATCPGCNWLSPEGRSSVWKWVLKRMDGPQSHDSTILFAAGQRILRYCSDVLETVVLVNPSEEAAVSEVNDLQTPPTPPGFTLTQQCGSSWVPFCEKTCVLVFRTGKAEPSSILTFVILYLQLPPEHLFPHWL